MDIAVIITVIVAVGTLNIACFLIGAKTGQAVSRGEKIQTPNVNPVRAYKAYKAEKTQEMEKNRIDIILGNIDRYDGTESGQEDVPR